MKLKCNSCNLVINELLAYLANKLSIADEASLVKICESTFSTNQIEEANSLLVDSLPSGLRRTERKGKGRENRMLHDIISLLKSTDPDILPVFVARDLEKLPPITFDHLDVSKFLKDLAFLQAEVRSIKESYVTSEQLQDVKNECLNLKPISPPFSAVKVNMKRGAYRDSGPRGLSELDDTFISNHANSETSFPNDYNKNLKYRNINYNEGSAFECDEMTQRTAAADCRVSSVERAAGRGGAGDGAGDGIASPPFNEQNGQMKVVSPKDSAKALSFAEAVQKEGEWKTVQRKKPKGSSYRFRGTSGISIDEDCNFKAAERNVPIFITKVHKVSTEQDITNYVYNKTKETIKLEKISFLRNKNYNAYKFFVPQQKLSTFLDEKLWPQGVIFRRFVNFRTKYVIE